MGGGAATTASAGLSTDGAAAGPFSLAGSTSAASGSLTAAGGGGACRLARVDAPMLGAALSTGTTDAGAAAPCALTCVLLNAHAPSSAQAHIGRIIRLAITTANPIIFAWPLCIVSSYQQGIKVATFITKKQQRCQQCWISRHIGHDSRSGYQCDTSRNSSRISLSGAPWLSTMHTRLPTPHRDCAPPRTIQPRGGVQPRMPLNIAN